MPDAYLDHAATTPMRPEALAAMVPVLQDGFGNPSGAHRWAREARRMLDDARDVVAAAVGAEPSEVVFTSGGTEADNLAVAGVTEATGRRPLCSAVEHHAVLRAIEAVGGTTVPVHPDGSLDLDALRAQLHEAPVGLVSVMLANNETGIVADLDAVGAVLAEVTPGAVLHTDAVAAAPWLDLPDRCRPAALVTLSGHKVGGPKGIGALVVRAGTPLVARQVGGGQERERRSGTPDVAGAVGFAAALAVTVAERGATVRRVESLRDRLVAGLRATVPGLVVVSPDDPAARTAGTALVAVPGLSREALVFLLDQGGVAASWGSSCASGATEPSHVLGAMGVAPEAAEGSLRLSLGWCTTAEEVDHALAVIPAAVAQLRAAAA
ncbi:MAG: cysteine desulfurase [Actinobacteria bacterium]|nr:cysteine desulfurase [Actinomycetota bacterium]